MRLIVIVALVVLAVDQASKLWLLHVVRLDLLRSMDVLPPFLNFRMAWNYGINFGLFATGAEAMRWGLVALAVVISGAVVWWGRSLRHPLNHALAGALVGGALANALDRVMHGAVMDFLNMSCCGIDNPYAFNLADVGVFVGAFGLAFLSGWLDNKA
ncbi:MAG: signal peptidase II [Rhodobacteraceae bacterium]|nr:signal peptidase II [Paracoccaceae bacterium]